MFVRVLQGRCARQEELAGVIERTTRTLPAPGTGFLAGFLGGTYGCTDDDQMVAVLRFDARAAAMQVCARPQVDAAMQRLMAVMDGPVEMHNCDDVTPFLGGGSDSAGFVQVIRGRVDDPARLKAVLADTTLLHEMRPEILGGTLAFEEDGTFTETVSFSDEHAARTGEKVEPPPDVADELAYAMRGAVYYDLPRPRFL